MVLKKTIVILITIAIILSIISVVVTVSTVNTKMVPGASVNANTVNSVPEKESAKIGIVVNVPTKTP